jgi:hypothetical protein
MDERPAGASSSEFFLIRGGPFDRLLRRLGIVAGPGRRVALRAALVVAVTWVPLAVYALLERRMMEGDAVEPLLRHFAIHARFLLALPILLAAEPFAESVVARVLGRFRSSGLVGGIDPQAFAAALRPAEKMRDSPLQLIGVAIAGSAVVRYLAGMDAIHDELSWSAQPGPGFGGWWYLLVSLPVYSAVVWLWLWRLLVTAVLMRSLARLPMRFVPTHPDRNGGAGFVAAVPGAFAPFVLALACVLAARLGHLYAYHELDLKTIAVFMGTFLAIVVPLCLSPALAWAPALSAVKRRARESYRDLVGAAGRAVDDRWVRRKAGESDMLEPAGVGVVADANALFEAVERIRPFPVQKGTVVLLVLAGLVPFLPVLSQEIPIAELLKRLLGFLL